MQRKPENVRALAAGIVRGVLDGRGAARTHLERAFARGIAGRDAAFLTELVYGSVRHRTTIDELLEACSTRGLDRTNPEVLSHLRVAAYQVLFLDRVPARAAVNEAVELVRSRALRGFANGVLRALAGLVVSRAKDGPPPEGVPRERLLPAHGGAWVVLREAVLPDARRDPAAWLAVATAHPEALARRWIERHGLDRALEVCRAGNEAPPLVLRANLLRTTLAALAAALAAEGVPARPGSRPEALVAEGTGDLTRLAAFRAGLFTVQDETAMAVAPLLAPRSGERVLDLCAAPGGKCTHLAELMGDAGLVVAADVDEGRLGRVRENADRLGLRSIVTAAVEARDPVLPGGRFDKVLCDAPCSNTGVLRRRVEARGRLEELDLAPLVARQRELAAVAAERLAPGGALVWSTCSLEPEENEEIVRGLLAADPSLSLEEERLVLPARGGGDGGYAARVVRGGVPPASGVS